MPFVRRRATTSSATSPTTAVSSPLSSRGRIFLWTVLALWIATPSVVRGYDYNYYGGGDDDAANGDDYYAADDDGGGGNNYYNGDDGNANANYNDDANANDDANGDDDANNNNNNDDDENNYWMNLNSGNEDDDDAFEYSFDDGFEGISIMPVSCINYNNGHMIQFELYDEANSFQCRFSQVGTFVVSIAHYMRAYFNYQALLHGNDFQLPGDAGYLNCIMLQETAYGDQKIYAKIGCMERETFTSTKLALHLYTDAQCSQPYDDGYTAQRHNKRGYDVNGYKFSTKVSFRPPFYTCQTCTPSSISNTFNKQSGTWYDDDFILQQARNDNQNNNGDGDGDGNDGDNDDANGNGDDYYQDDAYIDDAYLSANDDVYGNANADDYYNRFLAAVDLPSDQEPARSSDLSQRLGSNETGLRPVAGQLESFEDEFWSDVAALRRQLYNNYYDVGDWNMCQRVYKYGVYCDEDCRSLNAYRTDRWSGADIILLAFLVTFISGMMLLIVAKRLKATQKQRIYGEMPSHMPGLPPVAMFMLFMVLIFIVIVLAKLNFVNETLIFAVVTCILLFIYMLKLTLFDNRKPVLLAPAGHYQAFDNPMDARIFS